MNGTETMPAPLSSATPPEQLQAGDKLEHPDAELLEGYSRMYDESNELRAGFDPLTLHLLSH